MSGARRRIGDRDARRLSIALSIGCLALLPLLCPGPESVAPGEAIVGEASPAIEIGDTTERVAQADAPIDSCEALAGSEDDRDLALLPVLCPDARLELRAARAVLLSAHTPSEALALVPMLSAHPELVALVQLVAAPDVPLLAAAALPDPATTQVSPVDGEVLAWVRAAEVALVTEGVDHDVRTRARGLLAKIHLQALAKLGVVPGEPVPPFARRVAALAMHHGRTFVSSHWRRRVAGLDELFAETEVQLSRVLQALEVTPFHADDALLADERDGVRAWLSGTGARARVAERRKDEWSGPGESSEAQLERLVAQGMFDLAVDRAAALAGRGDAPMGLSTLEALLVDAAARHDRPEGPARIRERLERVRARPTPPPEHGPGQPRVVVWPWASAELVAADAIAWAGRAREREGFARTHATARATAILRDRPDAARAVIRLAREDDAPPFVREAATWASAALTAQDPGRPCDLDALARDTNDPDRARRLAFAADDVP
jgi:hypothetical protein